MSNLPELFKTEHKYVILTNLMSNLPELFKTEHKYVILTGLKPEKSKG